MTQTPSTYLVAEIGQNHNGSVDIAKLIIDKVARKTEDLLFKSEIKPWNAVKFTKRDLNEELSQSAMLKPYNSPHSFGETYGEHRKHLELSDEEHYELYKYAKSYGLDVVETLCSQGCLSMLRLFVPDKIKVASRDLNNLPLIEALAETKLPIILSTGMGGVEDIENAVKIIEKHHTNISILHCLSQYPAEYVNINLKSIEFLKERFPNYKIGYSDHSIGIAIPTAAVALGAEIIEKHVTLDRTMKGTDQKGSLGPEGMWRMARDIRNLEKALGKKDVFLSDSVNSSKVKLERSIASKRAIKKGEKIRVEDIHLLSPGDGFRWIEKDKVVGFIAKVDIPKNEIIYFHMIT